MEALNIQEHGCLCLSLEPIILQPLSTIRAALWLALNVPAEQLGHGGDGDDNSPSRSAPAQPWGGWQGGNARQGWDHPQPGGITPKAPGWAQQEAESTTSQPRALET